MVIPGVISSTTGRYGPTNVSGTFRNQALMIHRAGGGVVDARGLLRGVGFRFSNAALTQMFREFNEAAAKAVGVNSIRDDFRPTQRTITQTGMRFKTRYQYSGIARLRDLETGITADIRVQFGDQRLLTCLLYTSPSPRD